MTTQVTWDDFWREERGIDSAPSPSEEAALPDRAAPAWRDDMLRRPLLAGEIDFDGLLRDTQRVRDLLGDFQRVFFSDGPERASSVLRDGLRDPDRKPGADLRDMVGSVYHLLGVNSRERTALMFALGDVLNLGRLAVGRHFFALAAEWTGYSPKYLWVTGLIARTWWGDARTPVMGVAWSKLQLIVHRLQQAAPEGEREAANKALDAALQGVSRREMETILGEEAPQNALAGEASRTPSPPSPQVSPIPLAEWTVGPTAIPAGPPEAWSLLLVRLYRLEERYLMNLEAPSAELAEWRRQYLSEVASAGVLDAAGLYNLAGRLGITAHLPAEVMIG